ncbi:epididymal-specific lipocalin-12 [Leopardus geoffroyi]|uniref:epididymal-specific lipocalin-12 n=1 Tax=Leopardus geoffroyi TaxID=46844 RepID=UPI001E2650F6|nr:epididymal-specific lipocalin-12 [Leopardus geoffroyi]
MSTYFVPADMGPWPALWVMLILLKGQSSNTQPGMISVLQSFQEDQFQGEWFVVGLAGSAHRKTDSSVLSPFTATFEKNENGSLKVSYAMTRGHRCITWSYVLIAAAQPGGFSVDNTAAPGKGPRGAPGALTDYSEFALMLSRRRSGGQSVLTVSLLCRTWVIGTRVLERFVHLVRAQGLSDNNVVFPDSAGPGLSGCGGSPDPA